MWPVNESWGNALTGIGKVDSGAKGGDFTIVEDIEADDEFRERIMYVAGDGAAMVERIHRAQGARLDEIAESAGLRRRRTQRKS